MSANVISDATMAWILAGDILKLLGAAAVPFSLYLAMKKIGYKVLITYAINTSNLRQVVSITSS